MINCIIVDDEPLARQLLKSYVDQVPFLNCIGVCKNVVEAFEVLHTQKVDLIFLDIEMPGITGINFLKSLKLVPKVIFTTAYPDYAVDAFELSAIDYLLKPITFDRFVKAVDRLELNKKEIREKDSEKPDHLFLKIDRKLVKFNFSDIVHIEAYGDYLKIHTTHQIKVTYMTLNKLERLLPDDAFIRIHRSTIINKKFIEFIEGSFVHVNKNKLAIGSTYRDGVMQRITAVHLSEKAK